MKKVISMFVFAFLFMLTTHAQRGQKKEAYRTITSEQKATLRVKKMALKLDLTVNQQRQVKALLKKTIEERMVKKEKKKKVTSKNQFQKHNQRLDRQLAFKKKMKQILNEKQYEKFKKAAGRKTRKAKMMKKRKIMKKHHKMKKNR